MKWKKIETEPPQDKKNPDGSARQFVLQKVFRTGYRQVTSLTANQISDKLKHTIALQGWEWLDEEAEEYITEEQYREMAVNVDKPLIRMFKQNGFEFEKWAPNIHQMIHKELKIRPKVVYQKIQ